jgi:DNA repair protein RadA/Sms
MARAAARYVCQSCGAVHSRWAGQCADCAEWNTIQQEAAPVVTAFSAKHSLSSGGRGIGLAGLDDDVSIPQRATTGIAELDRALGGGLVAGSAVLIGGDPGIGKSTLLLQAAGRMALAGVRVAYISGEEAADQVRLRARRLGLAKAPVALASATSVRDILTTLNSAAVPGLVVIDSIQTMHSDTLEGAPGTVSQVRAAAQELIRYAKTSGSALVLVGHVTKDGQIAGPRVLEHMVDTVLYFEGERSHQYRILRAVKNRFGGTDEIGVFAMGADGLEEVANPSSLFLTDRDHAVSGAVVFPALEGTRPVLVEIQALVVRLPSGATPRRPRIALRPQLLELRGLPQRRRGPADQRPRRRPGRRRGARLGADRSTGRGRHCRLRRDRPVGRGPRRRPRRPAAEGSGQARLWRGHRPERRRRDRRPADGEGPDGRRAGRPSGAALILPLAGKES